MHYSIGDENLRMQFLDRQVGAQPLRFTKRTTGKMHPINESPYTNDELKQSQPDWPERGLECPKCKTIIPQFADLTPEQTARLRSLIANNQKVLAMRALEALTGAPTRWAKIWVQHGGRPDSIGTTAPCPYCGKPLMTARAKQCPHCYMDWHDEQHPMSLLNLLK